MQSFGKTPHLSWEGGKFVRVQIFFLIGCKDCTHLAVSGPISRNYVVLDLRGTDFSIIVQIYAQSRIKREYPPRDGMSWPLPATEQEELLEWPLTAPVSVAAIV